jgi:hypothetical protein
MQHELGAAPAEDYETRSEVEPSVLIGLLRKSPDATARITIFAVALILAWHSWARWGNFQIDCGRDLYTAVQILHGKLLYRDVWFPYGPLPPYLEALLVSIFGPHFTIFYLFGIAITIVCALLTLQIGVMLEERAAGLAAAVLLSLQGFEQSLFSYVFPYTYAAPLGLLFSLLSAWSAIRHLLDRTGYKFVVAGLAAGLAILCKPEFGVACYVLLVFILVTETVTQRSGRVLVRYILECAPGVALWAAIYGWFFWNLTPGFILFDNWLFTPGSYFMRTYGAHYTSKLGLRFVPTELILLILNGAAALLLWYGVAKVRYKYIGRWPFAATVFVLAAVMASVLHSALARGAAVSVWALLVFPSGMFFIGSGFLAFTLYNLCRRPGERRLLAEAALAVFALLLSVRVLAQVEPVGFGIYYDVPLFMIFAIAMSRCARIAVPPPHIERRRKVVNSLLAAEVILLASILAPLTNNGSVRLETSWGGIYLEPADASIARQIIDFILGQKQRGRRVVVLPEGHMIYALTGTEAPSRWETLIPGVLSPPQEQGYIADLRRADPDYILVTNRKTSEYEAPYFGIDYDREIYQWIEANYHVSGEFGRFRRDVSQGWAALLYERRGQR